jgi:hypothetical protein
MSEGFDVVIVNWVGEGVLLCLCICLERMRKTITYLLQHFKTKFCAHRILFVLRV